MTRLEHPPKPKKVEVVAVVLELPQADTWLLPEPQIPSVDLDGRASLIMQRRPEDSKHDRGKLSFFGGKREMGETVIQAVERELSEELDLTDTEMHQMLPTARYLNTFGFDHNQTGRGHMVVRVFHLMAPRMLTVNSPSNDGEAQRLRLDEALQIDQRQLTLGARVCLDFLASQQQAGSGRPPVSRDWTGQSLAS